MFDTMTLTKVVGGLCGTLLVFLFANWAGTSLYSTSGGHHDGEVTQAYIIETNEAEGGAAEEVVEVAFADVYAAADPARGEKVFAKCKACHKLDGVDGTGPHLNGIVNKAVAAVDGFGYSAGMAALGGTWTPELLNEFLLKPKDLISDTKMTFAGLKKVEDRANLIAYLAGTAE